ncbi:MAG: hypothetical protein Fur007_11730 [Rhodoferax sp.]
MASIIPNRRRLLLAALATGGLMPTFVLSEAAKPAAQVTQRWQTRNTTLSPLSLLQGHLLFSGNATLGRVDPGHAQAIWERDHGLPGGALYRPRAAGDSVITGGLHALGAWNLADGQARWLHRARVQVGTPFVSPTHTLVGDGHELLALRNTDGHIDWRFASTPDTLASYAPTQANDTVFFGPGNGILYALDAASGQRKWQLDDSKEWQYIRQMYVSGNTLVAGTYTELLYGIDTASGQVLWKFKAGNFINSHHVAGDLALLWSPTGYIFAIDVANGLVRWRHQTTRYGNRSANWGHMMAELVSHNGRLYCLDMNHVLHVLDLSNGEELLRVPFDHDLRPTVQVIDPQQVALATETGAIQLAQW